METLIEPAALILGWLAQMLGALKVTSKSAGGPVSPLRWVRKRPYQTSLGIVGALAGYVVLVATGQLNAVGAFSAGYLGQDVIEKIASGFSNRFAQVGKG